MSERIEEIKQTAEKMNQYGLVDSDVYQEDVSYLIKELETKDFTIRSLEHNRALLSKELEEAQQRSTKWEKAFDNADKQYLKMEHEAAELRRQLANKSEKLAEAQQTIEVSKKLIEYDTAAMNKDEVTISKLKKIANDALGCMITMSAADNEHVQRIAGNLRALDGRE